MTSAIRSRRLAHAIIAGLPSDLEPTRESLRAWVARMGIAEWRTQYEASASEVLDLLDFTRPRRRSLLRTLLETGNTGVTVPITADALPPWTGPLTIEPARGEPPPAQLAIYAGDQQLATVASQDYADLSAILNTGLAIEVEIDTFAQPPTLSITLPVGDSVDTL